MDRRSFFTLGANKVAKAVTEHALDKSRKNAQGWIRPPYAIDELEFLLACTRCDKCVKACPHEIIFPLSTKLGVKVGSTPALDLLNKACYLCEDWPCVTACETGALAFPQINSDMEQNNDSVLTDAKEQVLKHNERSLPVISRVSIDQDLCLPYSGPECGACRVCPVDGAMVWNMEKPDINQALCVGCGLCREACVVNPKAVKIESIYKQEA